MISTQDLLDWQRLYDWTEQKPTNSVLGESCTNILCPLAEYLNEQTNLQGWSVGPSIKRGDERLQKSEWVKSLIEKTDEVTGKKRGPVTREQFLIVLELVKPEQWVTRYPDNALRVPAVASQKPCEECQKRATKEVPNLEYSLVGMTGVLCRACLTRVTLEINETLKGQ